VIRALSALLVVAGCHKADQTKDDPAHHVGPAPSVTAAAAPTPPDPAQDPEQAGTDRVPAEAGRDTAPTPQGGSAGAPAAGSIRIQTIEEAVAAKGKPVRLRGIAQREKLGDTINIGDLRVLCVGAQFPDASIGKTVEAEGTLNVTERHQATTNPKGEVSAGTAPGTKRWVLEHCAPR
jgi:hypothetical protein